jgi:hypothetical protein
VKNFLKQLFIFLLVILAINTLLFVVTRNIYYSEYEKVELHHETYLLADSRGEALGSYSDKYSIHNFSDGSDSYKDLYRKLTFLINNTKIKKVYLTADEHGIAKYRESKNNEDRSIYFLNLEVRNTELIPLSYLEFFENKYLRKYIIFFNAKAKDLLIAYFKNFVKSSKKEKQEWHLFENEKQEKQAVARFERQFNEETQSEEMLQYLRKIISTCKDNQVELVGIKFPVVDAYLKKINDLENKKIDSVLLNHDIIIIDLREEFNNKPDLFKNQDHLNDKGAVLFIDRLDKELFQ